MFYVKNSCVVCFLCGCLCVSAFKEQTNMVFIQLGQIKVNVAHSGAKQKSKKWYLWYHWYLSTKQEEMKATSTSQDNQG